jgi:hypothetical protein
MFAETTDNWTSTTAQADGFRIEFDDPASGGVGTTTIDIEEPLILTGLEAKARMNDPFDETTDGGGVGFSLDYRDADGSTQVYKLAGETSTPVVRKGWHVYCWTGTNFNDPANYAPYPQEWVVSASGSSDYSFYNSESQTTYYDYAFHFHKDNKYIWDVSDSSLSSHPLAVGLIYPEFSNYNDGIFSDSYDYFDSAGSSGTSKFFMSTASNQYTAEYRLYANQTGSQGSSGAKIQFYSRHPNGRSNTVPNPPGGSGFSGREGDERWGYGYSNNTTMRVDVTNIPLRTTFYGCTVHNGMTGPIHMFPYCEYPDRFGRDGNPSKSIYEEADWPNLMSSANYTANGMSTYDQNARNAAWAFRPPSYKRDTYD